MSADAQEEPPDDDERVLRPFDRLEDREPLTADDYVSVRGVLLDLTYGELHALSYGFVPAFLAVSTGLAVYWQMILVGTGVALLGTNLLAAHVPLSGVVRRRLKEEPHYFLGGVFGGVATAEAFEMAASLVGAVV